MDKKTLPPKGRTPVVARTLNIPVELYNRMIEEAGLKKGEVTRFILKAIEEKLDRERQQQQHEE